MSLMFFIIFKHSLNVNLGEKFLPSNPIGEVNMKNYTLSFKGLAYLVMYHAPMLINKMALPNVSIAIL